jgi:hypothetical protein
MSNEKPPHEQIAEAWMKVLVMIEAVVVAAGTLVGWGASALINAYSSWTFTHWWIVPVLFGCVIPIVMVSQRISPD